MFRTSVIAAAMAALVLGSAGVSLAKGTNDHGRMSQTAQPANGGGEGAAALNLCLSVNAEPSHYSKSQVAACRYLPTG